VVRRPNANGASTNAAATLLCPRRTKCQANHPSTAIATKKSTPKFVMGRRSITGDVMPAGITGEPGTPGSCSSERPATSDIDVSHSVERQFGVVNRLSTSRDTGPQCSADGGAL
jgi:hypothetical protein